MTNGVRKIILAGAALLVFCGCRTTSAYGQTKDSIPPGARVLHYDYAGGRNIRTVAFDHGVACQADGALGPLTYAAADAGKPGIRRLTNGEAAILVQIRRYISSPTLRFTWLGGQFIVYDAIYGVCNGGDYWAMNVGCNQMYSPTDTKIDRTLTAMGCMGTPAPWMP